MRISAALKKDLKGYLLERMKNKTGRRVIEIQTPHVLTDQELKRFRSFVGDNTVTFHNTINPELLGGFILIDGSKSLDASISGQLNTIVNLLLVS